LVYGVLNYTDGWSNIKINKNYIKYMCRFFSDHPDLDIYIDHHGDFDDRVSIKV
jgi:hypothetical protein